MSTNPPPERPDFEPPDPSWVWPGTGPTAPPPPVPAARMPGAPPPPLFPSLPPAGSVVLPPGPYKQPSPPPPPSPQDERGSFLFGMGISLVTLAVAWWITIGLGYRSGQSGFESGALSIATALLIVLGIVLVVIPRTMRTGAGVLVGFIVSMVVAGAVWVLFVLNAVS